MQTLKTFTFDHFELLMVFVLVLVAEVVNFYLMTKITFLNFYFFPVLLAGYFIGKRQAIMTSLASVFTMGLFFAVWPENMIGTRTPLETAIDLSVWAFFLILAGFLIGTLYEQKTKRVEQLKLAYIGILEILSKYLESYDRYTQGHSVRTSKLATKIAIRMGLPRHEIENVRVGALLHDIGKVDTGIDLIKKSAQLTHDEKELIEEHSSKGAEILSLVGNVLQDAMPLIQAYQDSYLDAESTDLLMGAMIIAIADNYDTLVMERPYRAAITASEAMSEIETESGRKFDPQVVAALRFILSEVVGDTPTASNFAAGQS